MSAARAAGEALARLAIRSNGETSWIGLVAAGEGPCAIYPLGIDLYDGLSGVALFLAHLGAVTGERRYTALARQTRDTILGRIENQRTFITSIGAHSGWGGVIYALGQLGALWGEVELLDEAEALVTTASGRIDEDDALDIIGGAAGCIAALLTLFRRRPSRAIADVAVRCGEHLIARVQRQERGSGWIAKGQATPLTGFAHGTAGIAWALFKLATAMQDERFRTVALEGVAWERSQFSIEARNWRVPGRDADTTGWCYGAPGIGLARLSALDHPGDRAAREEIDVAIETTLERGFGSNHSLCHGDLGNAELVLQAATILNDSRCQDAVLRIGGAVVKRIASEGYLCGTPSRITTPGLMTGLAGIGYGLLRLAEPGRVPSVLTLEPFLRD